MTHELAQLLAATRKALLAGDLAALPPLSEAVEAALEGGWPNGAVADADAAALHAQARENARLLEAAMRGVKAARRRLAEISASRDLVTYDASGQRGVVATSAARQTRRA